MPASGPIDTGIGDRDEMAKKQYARQRSGPARPGKAFAVIEGRVR
jgi:hypothetical protein